ncbi:MAG: thiamine pyrophosphate-binding protein [Pseudomonadota bacterium]
MILRLQRLLGLLKAMYRAARRRMNAKPLCKALSPQRRQIRPAPSPCRDPYPVVGPPNFEEHPIMSQDKIYTHQSIARALMDHEADTMFGLMGDATLFMVDHYAQALGGRFVPAVHEASAVLMAMAYAHVANRVGVATVTHGPALTNCVTPLIEGVKGRSPIVLLAGDTPVLAPHNLQNVDQREIVKSTGAGFEQVRAPETAAEDLARAFHRARVERRPIVLNMPVDFMWEETEHKNCVLPIVDTPAYVPGGEQFDEAIGMIASAKRPIIVAGKGAYDARDQIIKLAERMDAPLATTLKGRDQFRGHKNNIGIFGTLSTPGAYEAIGMADVVIAFGASLHFFTVDHGALVKDKKLIHINTEAAAIGVHVTPDAALIADAGLTADNIIHWLDEAEIAPSGFASELDPASVASHPPGVASSAAPGYVDYAYALDRLNEALPADRVLCADGGQFTTEVWARVVSTGPRDFIYTVNFASIGLGMAEAIGAAFAAPGRPVAHFTGDGGFMMGGLTEFNTAVRENCDLIVILCNDAAYGAEHVQFRDRQMSPKMSQFTWPSFAVVANSLGAKGVSVASAEELETAIEAIENRDGPILIELRLNPDDMPRMRA